MDEEKLETLKLINNIFNLIKKNSLKDPDKEFNDYTILFWSDRINIINKKHSHLYGDYSALRYDALEWFLAGKRAKSQTEYNMNGGSVYAFLDQISLWGFDFKTLNTSLQEILIEVI